MGIVGDFMNDDHAKLNRMWHEFMQETQQPDKAAELFEVFSHRLLRHIELEDTVLFSLFSVKIGIEEGVGLSVLVRRDHDMIKKLLTRVQDACKKKDIQIIQREAYHLHRALTRHRERENQIQYSVLDRFVSEEEWKEISKKMFASQVE